MKKSSHILIHNWKRTFLIELFLIDLLQWSTRSLEDMINHYIHEGIISYLTADSGIAQDMLTEEEIKRARNKNWTHRDLMPLQIKQFLDPDYFKLMSEFKKRTDNVTDCDNENIPRKRQKRRASTQKKEIFELSNSADDSDNYGCNEMLGYGWDTDDDLQYSRPQSSRTTRNNNRRRRRYRKKTRRSTKAVSSKKNVVVSTPRLLSNESSHNLEKIENRRNHTDPDFTG